MTLEKKNNTAESVGGGSDAVAATGSLWASIFSTDVQGFPSLLLRHGAYWLQMEKEFILI